MADGTFFLSKACPMMPIGGVAENSSASPRALREFYDFAAKLYACGSRRVVIAGPLDGV